MSIPRNLSIIADTLNSDGTFASISNTGSTTLSSGTANGVAYLNGSKVLTTGSALTFDGTNVGIGGTPTWALDITTSAANIRVAPAVGTNNALTRYVNTGGTGYVGLDNSAGGLTTAYALNLYHTGAYPIVFSTSGTERMRIDSSGNVGIGTTSPSAKLQVVGTTKIGEGVAANTSKLMVNTVSGVAAGIQLFQDTVEAWIIQNPASSTALTFSNSGTERARIDGSGNLLVGTTSVTNNPTTGVQLVNGGGSTIGGVFVGHASGVATGNYYATFNYAAGLIGSITQSGTTAVLYNVTSDQRLKENIQDAESASALIDSLQVRQFDWKTDNSHQRYGFIAQELVTVAPEAVHQPVNENDMMAVDYSKLVPMLVKEIQSLRKRLADAGIA